MPIKLWGGSGNYATALYIAAAKTNAVEKVESELIDFVDAANRSPIFSQFMKDLSVPADIRVKAMTDISAQAKLSDVTKNFIGIYVFDLEVNSSAGPKTRIECYIMLQIYMHSSNLNSWFCI